MFYKRIMKKNTFRIKTLLYFLARMIIFCSLWLLFFGHPFIQNAFYAAEVFIGAEILIYCIDKLINKIKHNKN